MFILYILLVTIDGPFLILGRGKKREGEKQKGKRKNKKRKKKRCRGIPDKKISRSIKLSMEKISRSIENYLTILMFLREDTHKKSVF